MKISNLYLNTLLAGLVVLLTFILILLYLMQSDNVLASRNTPRIQIAAPSSNVIKEVENKISALENRVARETEQTVEQRSAHHLQIKQFEQQVSDLKLELEQSKLAEQKAQTELGLVKNLGEQLALKLSSEESRATQAPAKQLQLQGPSQGASQVPSTGSDSKIQELEIALDQEKRYIKTIRANYEKDKIRMLDLANELQKKKSELVKSKRRLALGSQALTEKSRELSISNGRFNDAVRRNEFLNSKVSRLRVQEQEFVSRRNPGAGAVN